CWRGTTRNRTTPGSRSGSPDTGWPSTPTGHRTPDRSPRRPWPDRAPASRCCAGTAGSSGCSRSPWGRWCARSPAPCTRAAGRGDGRQGRGAGREGRHHRRRRPAGTSRKAAAHMTQDRHHDPSGPAVPDDAPDPYDNRRQVLYWRLLARLFDPEEQAALESASLAVVEDIGLPSALLDPGASVDSVVQRHPELADEFDGLLAPEPDEDGARDRDAEVRRAALASKVLLNVFDTGSGTVTAGQLARWQSDTGWLERAFGCRPGDLRGTRGTGSGAGGGVSPTGTGGGRTPDLGRLVPPIGPELGAIEAGLVKRMHLREVLADPKLASRLTPSMSLIEQLLRDKDNLSGVALANAKSLIRRYVDEVAQVLRTQVEKATVGELDRSVPPKRVFRNLDL